MFGLDRLQRHLDSLLNIIRQETAAGINRLERKVDRIMADLQSLKDLVDQARGDAQAEAQEVKSKLDEMNALIQQLQQNTNDPAQVQAIADDLGQLRTDIQGIFTGDQTPPPSPGSGRGGRR